MRLIQFLEETRLDEMTIRYKSPETTNYQVVAFRDLIWLLDYNDLEDPEIMTDLMDNTGLEEHQLDSITDYRPDIFVAQFSDGEDSLWISSDILGARDPRVSQYVRKVARALGASSVQGEDMGYDEGERPWSVDVTNVPQGFPDTMMHGTDATKLPGILRFGLDPGRSESNWAEIGIEDWQDLVFLTVKPNTADFHARRSAGKNHSAPVVLTVKIPDKNLIGPDFDVASAVGPEVLADVLGFSGWQSWERDEEQRQQVLQHSGPKVWKEAGIYSYKGRIPASHIIKVEADLSGELGTPEDDTGYYEFETMEEFSRAWELFSDYGYWHPGMEEELEDYEDEEEEDEDY